MPEHSIFITPGPWIVESSDDRCVAQVEFDGGGCEGATIAGNDAQPNAVAVAAVPDLLDLVARAYRALQRGQWEDGETDAELSERINDTMCNHFGEQWCR